MSVMQQIQATAGGSSEFPRFSKHAVPKQQMAEPEAMMMANPLPGQSLTQSPDSRLPYEKPPKFTDVQDFIDETFMRFTDPEALPDLLETMRLGLPVEHITEKYLDDCFRKGEITPDLVLLCIEPTIYMLIALATYAHIEPVLYPEDPMVDEEASKVHTDFYRKASRELLRTPDEPKGSDGKITVEDLQAPPTAPKSLLARSKEAVAAVNRGGM